MTLVHWWIIVTQLNNSLLKGTPMPRITYRPRLIAFLLLAAMAFPAWSADVIKGRALYNQNCQNCHGSQGKPQLPGTPDFSRGERMLRADHDLIMAVRHGKGMMPAFEGRFEDEDFFNLVAYLRTLRR